MKKIFFIVILLLIGSCCKRSDCSQCAPIYKPEIIVPTFACSKPENYSELQKQFMSSENAKTEGELFKVITTNVKMQERHIAAWQNYAECIESTVENYEKIKSSIGNKDEEQDQSKE